jgi:predicted Zn finger-like uncharacterized protein
MEVVCPGCGAAHLVQNETRGGEYRCEQCQHVFSAGGVPTVGEEKLIDLHPSEHSETHGLDVVADEPAAVRRPRRKKRSALYVVTLILAIVLFVCICLGGLVYLVYVREIEEPVTDADRAVLLTADRLTPFFPVFRPGPGDAKAHKIRRLDGSHKLTYEYITPEMALPSLFMECTVTVETSEKAASGSFSGMNAGMKFRLARAGDEAPEIKDLEGAFQWGDESRYLLLMRGNRPVGTYFSTRKGKRVFDLTMGVYFAEPQRLGDLLRPILERLDHYEP